MQHRCLYALKGTSPAVEIGQKLNVYQYHAWSASHASNTCIIYTLKYKVSMNLKEVVLIEKKSCRK